MVSVKKIVASALVGVLMFSAVGCNMVEKTQAAIDKTTVATVNGEKITLGEVDSHLKGVFTKMKSQYGDKYMDIEIPNENFGTNITAKTKCSTKLSN